MKPKEWLLKNGHIKEITRGRISKENLKLIENAVANGILIEGYKVSVKASMDKPKAEKAKPTDVIYDVPSESHPENLWSAYTPEGPVGIRTVCNTCNNSLNYCLCQHPRVWVDVDREAVVFFKPRKQKG